MTNKVSDPVPLVNSLDAIYSPAGVLKNSSRWSNLATKFSSAFDGAQPDFIARAPGRVNLIGEHIDYVGFSVFPAAIEKDILMATKVTYASSSFLRRTRSKLSSKTLRRGSQCIASARNFTRQRSSSCSTKGKSGGPTISRLPLRVCILIYPRRFWTRAMPRGRSGSKCLSMEPSRQRAV